MTSYVALFRGINVGGKNILPMQELRNILASLGCEDVQTYIQSGNVIFQSSSNNKKALEQTVQKAILDYFSFEVPVLVRNRAEIKTIFDKLLRRDVKFTGNVSVCPA